MKINMMKLKVRDLVQGYCEDDSTSKVTAWNGNLDVRPEYQREYVYDDQKRHGAAAGSSGYFTARTGKVFAGGVQWEMI